MAALEPGEESLLLAASYRQKPRTMVVIKNNLYTAQQLFNRLYPLLQQHVRLYAVEESLRVEAVAATPTMYADQMETLAALVTDPAQPVLLVTHPAAVIRYLPTTDIFRRHIIELKVGQKQDMDDMRRLLTEGGYRYVDRVDQPLTYAVRGGVIDVFTIQENMPLRIEFFDDEIDSLRYFDPADQRTLRKTAAAAIMPATDLIYGDDMDQAAKAIEAQLSKDETGCAYAAELQENVRRDVEYLRQHVFEHYLYRYRCFFTATATLLDYLPEPDIYLVTPEEIATNREHNDQETVEYIQELYQAGQGLNYYSLHADYDRVLSGRHPYHVGLMTDVGHRIRSTVRPAYFPQLSLPEMVPALIAMAAKGRVMLSLDKAQTKLVRDAFYQQSSLADDVVTLMPEGLTEGFELPGLTILTSHELFGTTVKMGRYAAKFKEAQLLNDYQDLNPGDYIVHSQYGIGRYVGIETKAVNNIHRDYLKVLYRDDDVLLVPLEQFRLVRKFVGAEGVGVRLTKLGTDTWSKTKEKIKEDVLVIAKQLMELYQARQGDIGYAFSKDDDNMRSFQAHFEYELTPDQKQAVREIKRDMESPRPMDRLLCGDVGFGKTEVAMIAAFKCVNDLRQVAYLCPTTILSRQHYNTFSQRFKGFGVKIALLNRYVPDIEQKKIIRQLKAHEIDIVIGTHRLLSADIEFSQLGLLIIDEEQRFGVEAKEKVKKYKKTIDVLSLSATPIPRTLQMSLIGVRSLSQLDTPPLNRLPIQTYVVEKNDTLVKEVIQRELARGGQVFYLHNNVTTIYATARRLGQQLPDAKIAVAHGQMEREAIEDVMYQFTSGAYDILVCTTIIETGIDISNANTIIIDKADLFGLAQLYQIRGRVGRSDRIAYAYLMYDGRRQLTEVATKRLQAIKDFTELGSGYKVAMRDLTIRGAGDLLGDKQAGFINTVGMDMYVQMLHDAIAQQKGQPVAPEPAPKRISDIDGYIPARFSPQDKEKLSLYQRIDAVKDIKHLLALQEEITDRYGQLPKAVKMLFEKKRLEVLIGSDHYEKFEELAKIVRLTLTVPFSQCMDGVKLFEGLYRIDGQIQPHYTASRITITYPKGKNWFEQVIKSIDLVEKIGNNTHT